MEEMMLRVGSQARKPHSSPRLKPLQSVSEAEEDAGSDTSESMRLI